MFCLWAKQHTPWALLRLPVHLCLYCVHALLVGIKHTHLGSGDLPIHFGHHHVHVLLVGVVALKGAHQGFVRCGAELGCATTCAPLGTLLLLLVMHLAEQLCAGDGE